MTATTAVRALARGVHLLNGTTGCTVVASIVVIGLDLSVRADGLALVSVLALKWLLMLSFDRRWCITMYRSRKGRDSDSFMTMAAVPELEVVVELAVVPEMN